MKNTNWVEIGAVLKKDDGKFFVTMGDSRQSQYAYTVELTVKDAQGNVVAHATNPLLNLQDPRTRPNATPEQIAKIPEKVKFRISLPPAK